MNTDYKDLLGDYKRPDFYKIASELFHRVSFVACNCKKLGTHVSGLETDGEMRIQNTREWLADGLEMWPGVKVDRKKMHEVDLTQKELAARKKARE
jgi:hypothetical protein